MNETKRTENEKKSGSAYSDQKRYNELYLGRVGHLKLRVGLIPFWPFHYCTTIAHTPRCATKELQERSGVD
jgi:hypothetical protein